MFNTKNFSKKMEPEKNGAGSHFLEVNEKFDAKTTYISCV
jgi:hypothetical protein